MRFSLKSLLIAKAERKGQIKGEHSFNTLAEGVFKIVVYQENKEINKYQCKMYVDDKSLGK